MIKLQDFAREQGVTDRAIQKHLKKYAAELEGLFERKGPNGTWLSDEACTLLRSKMKQQPVVHLDEDPRVAKLEAKLEEKERQLDEKEKLIALAQTQVQELLKEAGKVKGLEEGKRALEGKIEALAAENEAQRVKMAETEKKASEDVQKARDELEAKTKQLEDEKHLLQNELQADKERIQELENRNLWHYLSAPFRRKHKE